VTIYLDADRYPAGVAVSAAGAAGIIGYVGTPGRTKSLTAAVVADYRAHGVAVLGVYEDGTNDVAGGRGAGVAHAQAALADMRALGLPDTTPVCAAADEHLTAGMIPTAVAYQAGFRDTVRAAGWRGPVGAYGFAEFLAAVRAAGVADWLWQCGTHPAAGSGVNLWQRNGSDGQITQMTIGGIRVDLDDLLVLISGGTMTDPLDEPIGRLGTHYDGTPQIGGTDLRAIAAWSDAHWDQAIGLGRDTLAVAKSTAAQLTTQGAQIAGLVSAVTTLTEANAANQPITKTELTDIVDQAVAQHVQITGTVQISAAPTIPAAAPAPATTT
jgi:hypothetical protein